MLRLQDLIKHVFVVKNPATDAAIDADALPTVALYKNGVADVAVVLTVTKLATGLYLASGAMPNSGYSPYDSIALVASYAVAAVAMKSVSNDFVAARYAEIDMDQAVPVVNTTQTVGDTLNAARAQGFGPWEIVDNVFTLYAADNSTVVRQFVLNDANNPTRRT